MVVGGERVPVGRRYSKRSETCLSGSQEGDVVKRWNRKDVARVDKQLKGKDENGVVFNLDFQSGNSAGTECG